MLQFFGFAGKHTSLTKREGYRMKQWLKKRKARGFTLVELLIVIVIIGILAGSLLLVMGSGTDKANATKIVSDMRTLKAAALMYYADNTAWPDGLDKLNQYLDRSPLSSKFVSFDLVGEGIVSADLALEAKLNSTNAKEGLRNRLEDMAEESGLYNQDLTKFFEAKDDAGYMIIVK